MIYLASPYSHPSEVQRETNYQLVMEAASMLINDGRIIFSPIVHCHAMAEEHNMPTDFTFWNSYCLGMVDACTAFYVLKIPGWKQSKGLEAEFLHARKLGKTLKMLDPTFLIASIPTASELPWETTSDD